MTFQWHNLLADDDGGIINILVVVAMLIFGLVGHFIKKAQEKQQAEQADQKVQEAKHRHAQMVASRRPNADSASPVAPPLRPATAAQRAAAVLQAAMAAKTKPPPPPRAAKPQPLHAQFDLAEGVREEVRKAQQHLSAEEADRSHRMERPEVLKSDIGSVSLSAEAPAEEKPKIRLNLGSPKAARTAIICAEVLGPPKALRSDPEPWER